jgi:uncharacterized membrane protein YkvA (DUF1232 family)
MPELVLLAIGKKYAMGIIKERAKQLKTDIPAVFIAMKRRETPLLAKIVVAIAVGYALSPIDLIPDFIPVIGLLDDVIIVPGLIAVIVKLIPDEVFAECRKEAADLWMEGKPKKWYYALPIIIIWLFFIFIIVKAIWL